MTRFFEAAAAVGAFLLLWFLGLVFLGFAAKLVYLSLLAGWSLV